ncbi:MAG: hypothetical protein KME60_12605 [Cyanomargarita calcarea GSE-NOS-MK-12-04C]|jgi:hypothetical protein|uniref:Uncharacterized protein n=1 Tax=Cyanomargarita calcarea GSE-NOS-MK-12-04C TaxID=2839659 RepID=A0A951UT87_9CYAN|nr:hypothetical protein [Cyanomargarita calcarea GSE-NOS-MK-12-04C]
MAESSQQPATQTNDTLPSSTHIQRFEHRRTEPCGIVDVRPLQSRFTRVPEWIVQRSAVLDGILKRYSSQNNTSAEEADLVLVAPSQSVPRDDTLNLPSATQTTTASSVPIARASRAELTTNFSPTPTESSPVSSKVVKSYPLEKKGVGGVIKDTGTSSPTTPSPPSGQFRVSRKAIPLPKIQESTSSQTESGSLLSANTQANYTVVSAKKDLGEGKSEDEDEASSITYSSIDASNHPLAEEITPISHQSQNPEPSLIFPKRLSQNSTNYSENFASSSQLGIESFSNNQKSIQTNFYQSIFAREITTQPEISQILAKSLILPKRLSPSTKNLENFGDLSELSRGNIFSNQNSIQTDFYQPNISQSIRNQPTLAREIANQPEISQISIPSLILPKRLQQPATSDSTPITFESDIEGLVKSSSQRNFTQPQSSMIGKEILKFPPQQSAKSLILPKPLSPSSKNLEKSSDSSQLSTTNIFSNQNSIQTDIYQSTRNQPTLAREIITKPEISQISPPSLILPKRLQQIPSTSSTPVTFEGDIERSVKSYSQRNFTQPNLAPSSRNNTQPQSSMMGKEILKFPPQQSAKSLILPKPLSPSTKNLEKSGDSSQISTGKIFSNQKSIQTNFYQSTRNQPTLAREIITKPEISQTATQSLILPKRLQQESSPTADSTYVLLQGRVERPSISGNLTQPNIAQTPINKTQHLPPIVGEIPSINQLLQSQKSLILPKSFSQEATKNYEKYSSSSQLRIDNSFQIQTDKPKTINQPILAREIATKPKISQISTQYLILPKRFQQETSQNYGISHVSLQDGIKQSSKQENSTQQNIAKVSTKTAQNQLPIVGEIASRLHEFPQPEPSLILPKRLSEASTRNAESSGRSRNLPTSTLQQKVGRESSLKTSVVASAQSVGPLQAIASEIPSTENSLEQQNMVWRKNVSTASSEDLFPHVSNSNHQAGMPLAINSVRGGQYIDDRKISTTSSPNSIATTEVNNARQTTTATPAQTNAQTNEINVAQIAEQVSRILHRNLSIERERRGMNLWY